MIVHVACSRLCEPPCSRCCSRCCPLLSKGVIISVATTLLSPQFAPIVSSYISVAGQRRSTPANACKDAAKASEAAGAGAGGKWRWEQQKQQKQGSRRFLQKTAKALAQPGGEASGTGFSFGYHPRHEADLTQGAKTKSRASSRAQREQRRERDQEREQGWFEVTYEKESVKSIARASKTKRVQWLRDPHSFEPGTIPRPALF